MVAEQNPGVSIPIPDFAAETWEALTKDGLLPRDHNGNLQAYSPRLDGMCRPVPNAVLKIPTGGGKTWLAVGALSRIFSSYLGTNNGFVLWIVPNEAIYSQTLRQLRNRQHPIRQLLDQVSAGRTVILEKDDPLHAADVGANLCVMILMLQSANRETKETLKMFRDRGDVYGFVPPEGDQKAHQQLRAENTNLDAYAPANELGSFWPMVKDSLGNALRLIRPVVVMDEGHKATSAEAFKTLYGFNPSFVLELTATPKVVKATDTSPARPPNVLVNVTGAELDREGMIKMPLDLDSRQGTDWHDTLRAGMERLDELQRTADTYRAESDRYIRPIMLVQVERTGSDTQDGQNIHAYDVEAWLKEQWGLQDSEIAIKTADQNDLADPENLDLLAETNRVRVIITKQALQEGWDCPFAYVLCALAASSSSLAMTQLIGRILRQPGAEKTGVDSLDQCYVITHQASTGDVVRSVKKGLEQDGLGDLVEQIRYDDRGEPVGPRQIDRRDRFRDTPIYLPQVLKNAENGLRNLDYETDVLYQLDWNEVDIGAIFDDFQPGVTRSPAAQLTHFEITDGGIQTQGRGMTTESRHYDPVYITRMLVDIVPNPWIARQIVGQVEQSLRSKGFTDEQLGDISGLILDRLRAQLSSERDRRAEILFHRELAAGRIQFRLRLDAKLNWQMPVADMTALPERARKLRRSDDTALQLSLFEPVYEEEFNSDEREVAVYLDEYETIQWWHRNVARNQYSLQGWRRGNIYPDFVCALGPMGETTRLAVIETKGEFLGGTVDTEYKRKLLDLLSEKFSLDQTTPVGTFEIREDNVTSFRGQMVMLDDWQVDLQKVLSG